MTAWPTKKLGEICRPRQWPTLSKSEMQLSGVPVYGANGIIGFTDKPTHHQETILVGCRGSCGTIHVLKPPAYANGNAMALDDLREDLVFLPYLEHHLRHRGFDDVTTGASQPQIVQRNINQIEIPLPPLEEQKRIAAILDQADDIRRKRQHAIYRLNQLGQAIFYEMFGSADRAGWSKITLSQLCEMQVGFPFKSSDYAEVEGAIRLCRGANVLPGKIEWSDKASLPEPLAKKHLEFSLREGDIVIAMDRPWISSGFKVARIESEDLPSLLVQRVARLRAIDEQDGEWVHFLVNGAEFQKSCKTTETTIPHISPNDIRKFEFFCPPKPLRHQFHEKIKVLRKAMIHSEISASSVSSLFATLQHRAFTGQL
jgi:type I restriction enzyme S subunit